MKQFIIKITDANVYINGRICEFAMPMDKEEQKDDLNKKALVALANEMGYEAVFLFEEMADRLAEMLDEIDDDEDDDFLSNLMEEAATDEFVRGWIGELLERLDKDNLDELTIEDLRDEIEEMHGTIKNESILIGVSEFAEENIKYFEAYIEYLEALIEEKELIA